MNLANHMIQAGKAYRAYPATALGTTILQNYGDLANRVARLAGALVNRYKLEPGDRVALVLQNCPEYLELLYAAWHAGLVVVPINAKLHRNEFDYILANSEARLCFVSEKTRASIEPLIGDALETIIEVGGDEYESILNSDPGPMVSREANDAAWLFYTSGTTGQPKGAVLSHLNLNTCAIVISPMSTRSHPGAQFFTRLQ